MVKKKACKACDFVGKVGPRELCDSCEEKMSDGKCGVCECDVGQRAKGLHCDLCQHWFHAHCERINDKLYKELQGEEELPWACTKCLSQAKRNSEALMKVREEKECLAREQARLDEEVKNLRECLGAVERENRSLRDRIKDLERQQVVETVGGEGDSGESMSEARAVVGPEPAKPGVGAGITKDVSVGTRAAQGGGVETAPLSGAAPAPKGKAKIPIVCVGDSMVKNVDMHMAMRGENSQLMSLSGKGIGDVTEMAKEKMRGLEEGMVILQGGGNGLRQLGPEQTVKKIMECVREVKREKKIRVAVVGVLGRPRESRGYEELRRETNRRLQQEVVKMKIECTKREGDLGVSFLDLDDALPPGVYGRDGVHLNREGDRRMCKRFLEWVMATERLTRMRERREERTSE